MMILSNAQNEAILRVKTWLSGWKPGSQRFFYLAGYAGTGKTTIARTMAENVRRVCFASFTGKAAHVMRSKGCDNAKTIHSLIYHYVDEDETGKPEFALDPDSEAGKADLIIIDECSMVDEFMGRDLLSFRRPVLVLGDPAQLPPVSGAGYFTGGEPDFLLTEVHRQGLESPILRLATRIRQGEPVMELSEPGCDVVKKSRLDPDAWQHHDQIIVGTNAMRRGMNSRVRDLLGHDEWSPLPGERLICLRNNKQNGLFNGQMWDVDDCRYDGKKLHLQIHDDAREIETKAHPEPFRGEELDHRSRRGADEFDFSYAITGHKSQGSEWKSVLAFDQSRVFKDDSTRWLYTVVTRAAENLTLVI